MFLHRMALELHMTVGDIKEHMTMGEMFDWLEYWDRIKEGPEPIDMSNFTPEQLQAALG